MNLESIVTNLELSKKLKELGVKQESLFYYYTNGYGNIFTEYADVINENIYRTGPDPEKICSVFTASELFEMLPGRIPLLADQESLSNLNVIKENKLYIVYYPYQCTFNDKNLSNALAKMRIHLIENKIIEV